MPFVRESFVFQSHVRRPQSSFFLPHTPLAPVGVQVRGFLFGGWNVVAESEFRLFQNRKTNENHEGNEIFNQFKRLIEKPLMSPAQK
mmetsp:Transcript_29785/g.49381  ORF Transcript_29785/g.49381 Transcript_29785/m.49381 type:complete len:87 (-) Transcript_29785:58-318(-)